MGIDARRSGMILTGVESAAAFSYWYPWPDYVVREDTHWIYEGTGLKNDDRIKNVMGYEIDSIKLNDPTFDMWRPKGQTRLSTMIDKDGKAWGSSGYYMAASGAEVLSLGAIAFSWAVDSFASGDPAAVDPRAQKMITNVMTRWSTYTPKPSPDAPDGGVTPFSDAGTSTDGDPQNGGTGNGNGANGNTGSSGSGGCSMSGGAAGFGSFAALFAALGLVRRRTWKRSNAAR
jgi:uncharacterized membrane protein YgcG